MCLELADKPGEAITCCNLANAYQATGNFQQTKASYERFLNVVSELHDRHSMAAAHGNLARIHEAMGLFEEATGHYQHQLTLAQELEEFEEAEHVIQAIANVKRLSAEGRPVDREEAIRALMAALEDDSHRPIGKKYVKQLQTDCCLNLYCLFVRFIVCMLTSVVLPTGPYAERSIACLPKCGPSVLPSCPL